MLACNVSIPCKPIGVSCGCRWRREKWKTELNRRKRHVSQPRSLPCEQPRSTSSRELPTLGIHGESRLLFVDSLASGTRVQRKCSWGMHPIFEQSSAMHFVKCLSCDSARSASSPDLMYTCTHLWLLRFAVGEHPAMSFASPINGGTGSMSCTVRSGNVCAIDLAHNHHPCTRLAVRLLSQPMERLVADTSTYC